VHGSATLEGNLARFLASDDLGDSAGKQAREVVRAGLGASERSYQLVSALLDGS